jgi:hypothetical protein
MFLWYVSHLSKNGLRPSDSSVVFAPGTVVPDNAYEADGENINDGHGYRAGRHSHSCWNFALGSAVLSDHPLACGIRFVLAAINSNLQA